MEIDLAKGEARHKEAILKVKEEARVELDTERQKQQELITKYQRDHEELQKKVCDAREKCVAVDDVSLWKTICEGIKSLCGVLHLEDAIIFPNLSLWHMIENLENGTG